MWICSFLSISVNVRLHLISFGWPWNLKVLRYEALKFSSSVYFYCPIEGCCCLRVLLQSKERGDTQIQHYKSLNHFINLLQPNNQPENFILPKFFILFLLSHTLKKQKQKPQTKLMAKSSCRISKGTISLLKYDLYTESLEIK